MDKKGLTTEEARSKLEEVGKNSLPSKKTSSVFKLLSAQFRNLLIWLLIFSSLLSFFVGHATDAGLILIILGLNVGLGFWQEYKASKELEALRKMEVAFSRVIRDGKQIELPSFEIVPGDIVILEAGDRIPADGKLIQSYDMFVNESALTGESVPVVKTVQKDQNELFFGTNVSSGRGTLQVVQTGTNTRFGKIAITLSEVEEEKTPLEISLNGLARNLGVVAVGVAVLVFVIRVIGGAEIVATLTSSIALMVAAVPEGLPAVVTVLLAIGVRKMYSKKTLVRKMSAVESLGATSVICTDKTGTLTLNKMKVRKVLVDEKHQKGILMNAIVCNSASLAIKEDHGEFEVLGDTTEGALLLWAREKKVDYEEIRAQGKILEEEPFNLQTRRMSVLWEAEGKTVLYSKGAPESIISICKLSPAEQQKIEREYKQMSSEGLRVLAFAKVASPESKNGIKRLEKNMEFQGLIGIADSPRPEAKLAIEKAREAGISTVMVTGDNELTAKAIGHEVGLLSEGDIVITGAVLDGMSDEELLSQIEKIRIFARAVPEHKLRIVKAYQSLGKVVAVTGDGVNDSLALKQAHVGIAMGTTGTDVAKEASDIIILDDNLSTIVTAIEEGRLIYSNILKVVKFLMGGNLAEVLVIVGAALMGLPAPLTATQILWINFVTDGIPALSLAADNASSHIMKVKPRDPKKSILDLPTIKYVTFFAGIMTVIILGLYIYFYDTGHLAQARTITFSLMVGLQMIYIFIVRRYHSIWSNKFLLISVCTVLGLQVLIVTNPILRGLFGIN